MPTKTCKCCHLEKDCSCFSKNTGYKDGFDSICKECRNWKHLTKDKQEWLTLRNLLFIYGYKECAHCRRIKKLSCFRFAINRSDCLRPYCIECENELSREHDNLPEIKEKRRNRDKTPESKKKRREYRQVSPKFKATQNKYEGSEKRIIGRINYGKRIQVRIERRLRSRVFDALTKGKAVRKVQFWELTGCTVEEFMKYIEGLWEEGMSWDNYTHKGWHLDHIRPCASFDLRDEEQQKQCFHYTNYQPLWAEDNWHKNNIYQGRRWYRQKAS